MKALYPWPAPPGFPQCDWCGGTEYHGARDVMSVPLGPAIRGYYHRKPTLSPLEPVVFCAECRFRWFVTGRPTWREIELRKEEWGYVKKASTEDGPSWFRRLVSLLTGRKQKSVGSATR